MSEHADGAFWSKQREPSADGEAAEPFALTAPQMAIWLDQALYPNKPLYNTGQVLSLEADLDLEAFAKALRRVVMENDALRLRFIQRGARIFQHVVDDADQPLEVRDFSAEANPEADALGWLEQIFWEPVSPTSFPLFRFALAKVSNRHFLWLQRYHHLIIDATGRQLVAARVAAIHDALRAGEEPPSAQGGMYRMAKDAEDAYLSSDQYAADEAYWRTRFAALPEPIVRAPPQLSEKLRSGRPVRIDCGLTAEESARLRRFARDHGASPFKVILSLAWCCFARLYQTGDLVFGVPLAARSGAGARSTVGLFAKVMPFRLRLDPAMTLPAALAALDGQLSEDLKHQRFPTDHINRLLRLRHLNRAGVHEIALNYVRSNYAFDLGGHPVTCSTLSTGFSLPWAVSAFEFGETEAIRLLVSYDRGRVGSEHAERLGRCLRNLLSTVDDLVEVPLGDLPTGLDPLPAQPAPMAGEIKGWQPRGAVRRSAGKMPDRPPGDDIERQLLDIWRRHLNSVDIGMDDDFFAVGGDSLKAVLLVGACNERFGSKLPLSTVFEFGTVAQMAEAIRQSAHTAASSRLIRLRAGNGGPPLLLVHPVGGSVLCYADLVASLNHDGPIYGLQAAGLQGDEHLPESLEEMAQDYLHSAATAIGAGPVHLAGWSFGGLVAVEMARQLAAKGRAAGSVTLIDTPARLAFDDVDETRMLRLAAGATGGVALSQEQLERTTRVIRNARGLRQSYRPARIPVSLTLVRAASGAIARDEDFDWTAMVDGRITTVALPATHDSIIRAPHAAVVAKILDGQMAGRDEARP